MNESLLHAMEELEATGMITVECVECDAEITAEPDATKAYCTRCDRLVSVHNTLIENGMI